MNKIVYLKDQLKYLNSKINVFLLLFFILLSNSTYSLKLLAVILGALYLIKLNYPIRINKHNIWNLFKKDKTIWFYFSMISISILNLFLDFSYDYMIVVFVGIFFWLINLIIHGETLSFIRANSYEKILNTLKTFVVLNFILSIVHLIQVMIATDSFIPYAQMAPPPYGGMSGDFIQGFFLKEHLPNSVISTMFFIYFIIIKQYRIALISLATLLLASSSLNTLIVVLFLIPLFFLLNKKKTKYFIVLSLGFILVFYIKINPYNYYEILRTLQIVETNKYEEKLINKALHEEDELIRYGQAIDSLKNKWVYENEGTTNKVLEQRIINAEDSSNETNQMQFRQKNDSIEKSVLKEELFTLWETRKQANEELNNSEYFEYGKLKSFDIESTPGMIISLKQTKELLELNQKNMMIGNGAGNFSSILAFTSSKESVSSRLFNMVLPKYEHPDFTENHKAIWKFVAYKGNDYHSIKHSPYNTYNTILGEYGILGLSFFLLLFIIPLIFKSKKRKILALFMIPLFMILLGMHYWFETFTFIMFFELIMYNETRKTNSLK